MSEEKIYFVDLPKAHPLGMVRMKAFEVEVSASGALIFKNINKEIVQIYAHSHWESVKLSDE